MIHDATDTNYNTHAHPSGPDSSSSMAIKTLCDLRGFVGDTAVSRRFAPINRDMLDYVKDSGRVHPE